LGKWRGGKISRRYSEHFDRFKILMIESVQDRTAEKGGCDAALNDTRIERVPLSEKN
jgi:hypothetical protein